MQAKDGATSEVSSPWRVLAILLVVLFFAEAIVMFALPRIFHTSITFIDNFADSLMLILISAPFLWFLVARPLHATAREVERLNVSLAARAADLEMRNAELQRTYHELELETAARHRALEDLRKREQLLIQQSRMAAMGEMLGNIAHQWRQPLNVLAVKIQELGFFYKYGELSQELLDANTSSCLEILQHLSQTITVFQNFTLPDREKSLFRVDRVVRDTVQIIGESLNKAGITLQVETTGIPQIAGYPNEFSQVLMNIIMNAKDAFLERGIVDPRIVIRCRVENDRSVVTIADNGGGIEAGILDKIFDPYFTTKEPGKGTGIGLFLSKTIIEKNMGGRLTAHTDENGSEFRIEV